jgi:hypothetical protein
VRNWEKKKKVRVCPNALAHASPAVDTSGLLESGAVYQERPTGLLFGVCRRCQNRVGSLKR